MTKLRLRLTLLLLLFSQLIIAQSSNDQKQEPSNIYANANIGFGLLYGGYGLHAEIGKKHLGCFAGFGYATERQVDNITLKPSINYHAGLRYYFDVNSEVVFPRVGLGFGWITNYYNEKIGNQLYDQSVYGLSAQVGAQFYAASGIVVNFDIAMSSSAVILSPQTHPHFFGFYARPCIGIGYDLQRIFKTKKPKSVQNKEINPFG
jgi:hypothetical protein